MNNSIIISLILAGLLSQDASTSSHYRRQNAVLHWHRIATEILPVEAGPVIDSRAMSIVLAAVHDAVNGVERRYKPYTADLSSPGASLDAAVASASHDTLIALAPRQRDRIEQEYTAALDRIRDRGKEEGIALGQRAARANLERRANDGVVVGPWPPTEGAITQPVYERTGKPGDYDFTPPFDAPPMGPIALFPGWGKLTPFALDASRRHHLRGPDDLDTKRYARDFNKLKSVGALASTTRTPDQTATAFFWFEGFGIFSDLARMAIEQQRLDEWQAARVLALMSFAATDAGIVCFDAKYEFRFWRPFTAIRRADEDDNDDTEADPQWKPLLWTEPGQPPKFLIPPIPDYPSAAAITSAAAAEVLAAHLGDRISLDATSPTLPGVTRHFTSFSQAAREAAMSRVYGGIHFVKAVEDGFAEGKAIGREVSRMLPRVRR
jgi:hypothetical protein